jgi:hypothetical protein
VGQAGRGAREAKPRRPGLVVVLAAHEQLGRSLNAHNNPISFIVATTPFKLCQVARA